MDWDWPSFVFFSIDGGGGSVAWQSFWIAALGAILGGMLTFLTTLYFHARERRQRRFELSWAFYLALMNVFNDVFSVSSRYFEALGDESWPIEPWTKMPQLIGESNLSSKIPAELLSTISGPHARGIVNDVSELVRFRNQILATATNFSSLKSALFESVADRTVLGPGMLTSTELDPEKDKALIMQIRTLDDLAKQLLLMIIRFDERSSNVAIRYNTFTANHQLKQVRGFKAEFQYRRPWQKYLIDREPSNTVSTHNA